MSHADLHPPQLTGPPPPPKLPRNSARTLAKAMRSHLQVGLGS